uniref:KIB1-4 beta-propeller domain-containing protein n=1 Tax=Salix viminalis TaxID=40686 RepID=A0A6N2M4E4_SALVM
MILDLVSREFQRVTGPVIIDTVPDKLPWLLLPHDTQCESLKFYDLSRNKVHELNLPEVLLGGVSVEVSRGWLAIAKKGKYIRDTKYSNYLSFKPIPDTEIFLFNPLSGAIRQLPSLSTLVPYYYSFVTNCIFNLGGYNVAEFIRRIELSSADPSKSIIALRFNEFEANNCGNLALCRVRDRCWSTFPRETDRDIEFSDSILYDGDLCVLSQKIEHVETHIVKLAEDDGVRIKFIPVSTAARLPFIEAEHWGHNMATIKHALYEPYLVESINGELLIIVGHNVCYAYYDEDEDEESLDGDEDALEEERLGEDEDALEEERLDEDGDEERLDEEEGDFEHFFDEEDDIEEGDHFERFYFKISGFDVMEMDPNAGMILRSVQSLSDQLIF